MTIGLQRSPANQRQPPVTHGLMRLRIAIVRLRQRMARMVSRRRFDRRAPVCQLLDEVTQHTQFLVQPLPVVPTVAVVVCFRIRQSGLQIDLRIQQFQKLLSDINVGCDVRSRKRTEACQRAKKLERLGYGVPTFMPIEMV